MNCPICERETVVQYRPFCSRRCADVDLGRWMAGNYSIPSEDPVEDDPDLRDAQNEHPEKHH